MTAGRLLFAAACALGAIVPAYHALFSDRPVYAATLRGLRGAVAPVRLALALGAAGTLALALWGWTTGAGSSPPNANGGAPAATGIEGLASPPPAEMPMELGAALLLLLLMGVATEAYTRSWPPGTVLSLGRYSPAAACLLGWLAGTALALALGLPPTPARHLGHEAACGVFAAAWVLAGAAKLRASGLDWMHPRHHALLLVERSFSGPGPVRALRLAAARSRAVCAAVGVWGVASELAAGAFVWAPARLPVAVGLGALQLGITLLLGFIEPEWWLLTAGLALGG